MNLEKNVVGKFALKFESSDWSWKGRAEVGKYNWGWKAFIEIGKNQWSWKATIEVGKLKPKTLQLKTFQLQVFFNCPFQLHVSLEWSTKWPFLKKPLNEFIN